MNISGTVNVSITAIDTGPLYVTVEACAYHSLLSASTFPAATAVNQKYTNSTATIVFVSTSNGAITPTFQTFYLVLNGTRWLQYAANMTDITAAVARDVADVLDVFDGVSATFASASPFTLKLSVFVAAFDFGMFPSGRVMPTISSTYQTLTPRNSYVTIVSTPSSVPSLTLVSFYVRLFATVNAWSAATAANSSAVMRALEADLRSELDAPSAAVSMWTQRNLWILCNITTGISTSVVKSLVSLSTWSSTTLLLQQYLSGNNRSFVGTLMTAPSIDSLYLNSVTFHLILSGSRWWPSFRTNSIAMQAAIVADLSLSRIPSPAQSMLWPQLH